MSGVFAMHFWRAFILAIGLFSAVCEGAPPKAEPAPSDKKAPEAAPSVKRMKAVIATPLFIQQAAGVNTLANVTLTATRSEERRVGKECA